MDQGNELKIQAWETQSLTKQAQLRCVRSKENTGDLVIPWLSIDQIATTFSGYLDQNS